MIWKVSLKNFAACFAWATLLFCANKIEGLKEFMDAIGRKDGSIDLFSNVDELDLKRLRNRKYLKKFGKIHAKAFVVRKDGDVFVEEANKEDNLGEKYYLVHNGEVLVLYFVKDGEKIKLISDQPLKAIIKAIEKAGIKPVNIPHLDHRDVYFLELFDETKPDKEKYNSDLNYRAAFRLERSIGFVLKYNNKTFLVKLDRKSCTLSAFDSFGQNFRYPPGIVEKQVKFERICANGPSEDCASIKMSFPPIQEELDKMFLTLEKAGCKVANLEGIEKLKNYSSEESGSLRISLEPINLLDINPENITKLVTCLKGVIFWNKGVIYLANIRSGNVDRSTRYVPFTSFGEKLYLLTRDAPKEVEFNMKDGKIIMDIKQKT